MEDKSQWPTEARLERLREEGRVPHSPAASALLIAATLAVGVWLSTGVLSSMWSTYQGILSSAGEQGAQPVDGEMLSRVGEQLLQIGVALPLSAALLVVFLGLFQSKFLVRLSLFRLDMQRLLSGPLFSAAFSRAIRALLLVLFVIGLMLVSSVVLTPVASALLGVDAESFERVPELFMRVLAFMWGVVGTAAAIVLVVVSQLEFRHRNRMSSKEVREETAD